MGAWTVGRGDVCAPLQIFHGQQYKGHKIKFANEYSQKPNPQLTTIKEP